MTAVVRARQMAQQRPRPTNARAFHDLGRAAIVALCDEVALYPKPGLVSFVDSGSHDDMTGHTFLRSLFALRHYFTQMAALGAQGVPFGRLQGEGRAAEQRMMQATGGINTHRGAVFTLGLLCAAAGHHRPRQPGLTPQGIRQTLIQQWQPALAARCEQPRNTPGQQAAQRHGLRGAADEAALGFPVLFETAVPALQAAWAQGLDGRRARLQTLLSVMAVLDDTNLAARGGLGGLRWAQAQAACLLADGGLRRAGALADLERLHRDFIARRLSPGGSADLLAAADWVLQVCREPAPPSDVVIARQAAMRHRHVP